MSAANPITLGTSSILDDKERAVINRRRQLEEERKSRILNAKERVLGVDKPALDAQVTLRREMEISELQRDRMYDHYMEQTAKQLSMMEQQAEREKRAVSSEVNHFRQTYQAQNTRKEWDLNDPENLKRDIPARIGDEDPRCGPSSLQKFAGEDLSRKDRVKAQNDQMKNWTRQQIEERAAMKAAEEAAERLYQARQQEINVRRKEMEQAEEETKAEMAQKVREFNQAQAEAKRRREEEEKWSEVNNNLEEIRNHLESDLLNENPDKAVSAFGPHRVVPAEWKGMNEDQLNDIRHTQSAQLQAKAEQERRDKMEAEMWRLQEQQVARELLKRERAMDRLKRQQEREVAAIHQQQEREKKERYRHLEKEVYTNPPTEDYFNQFNTTSR